MNLCLQGVDISDVYIGRVWSWCWLPCASCMTTGTKPGDVFLKAFFIGFLSSKLSKQSFPNCCNFFVSVRVARTCCCRGVSASATSRALLHPGQLCCRKMLGPGSCCSCSRPLVRQFQATSAPANVCPDPTDTHWHQGSFLAMAAFVFAEDQMQVSTSRHTFLPLSPS